MYIDCICKCTDAINPEVRRGVILYNSLPVNQFGSTMRAMGQILVLNSPIESLVCCSPTHISLWFLFSILYYIHTKVTPKETESNSTYMDWEGKLSARKVELGTKSPLYTLSSYLQLKKIQKQIKKLFHNDNHCCLDCGLTFRYAT